jgi:hypothetical protein
MKLKCVTAIVLLMGTLASVAAHANPICTLGVNQPTVAVGQPYSFNLYIFRTQFSPVPPAGFPQFRVVYYGFKDGINDLPNGWEYPNLAPLGASSQGGYFNPGGLSGNYYRYAVIYDTLFGKPSGPLCVTNGVSVTLQ